MTEPRVIQRNVLSSGALDVVEYHGYFLMRYDLPRLQKVIASVVAEPKCNRERSLRWSRQLWNASTLNPRLTDEAFLAPSVTQWQMDVEASAAREREGRG